MTERKVDVLQVRWYERHSPGVAGRWLAAAEEHLPEAMPRRFGGTEPLRGRLDRDGTDGVHRAYEAAETLFFLAGEPPIYHASLAAERDTLPRGPVDVHTLSAVLDPADERVRAFALALTHPGTVYVSASVESGMTLDRRTLYGPGETRGEPYLAPRGDWLGLPPEPPEWCWFGPAYAGLARVPGRVLNGGLLYEGGPWVPVELRARLDEVDPAQRYARRRPRGTRRSLWQRLRR